MQFHEMIADLARSGAVVLLVSSESPEILSMSVRILVTRQGRIVDRLSGEEATEESVLSAAIYSSDWNMHRALDGRTIESW